MKKGFFNRLLQNTRKPEGFWGRVIIRSMNTGHTPLSTCGLSLMEWQPEWTVLDIGCGGGANLKRMLRFCPKGKVYGIDYSEVSIACSQKKLGKESGRRGFVKYGLADNIPFEAGSFDAVTAFESVYFWGDLQKCFQEVTRVLKPGGRFLICCEASDPSDTTWTERIEGMTVYSPDELRRILENPGFTDIRVYNKGKSICITSVSGFRR